MALKLYYDVFSQPSRALLILLKKSQIPYESCPVTLFKGEHLTEDFKQNVSRFQKVPVIKDGNFTVTESIAILRYLSREKSICEDLYPKDSQKQARVDEYLEWQHNNIRAHCILFLKVKWMQPKLTGKPADPKEVSKYEKQMSKTIDNFEKLWLENSEYIVGNSVTVADIWAACELEEPRMVGYDPEVGRPILSRWFKNVRQSLSPIYQEVHSSVNKIAAGAHNSKL